MKKIIITVVLLSTAFLQNIFAQTGNQSLNNVLTAYLRVKNALIKDKGDSVKAAADIMYNSVGNISMDKLSAEQRTIWKQYQGKLIYDLSHIREVDEIDHQREHFANLSKNMFKLLQTLKINTIDLYYQYCPMANDSKGAYWISEKQAIANPYLGANMPTCGSIKDTIKKQ